MNMKFLIVAFISLISQQAFSQTTIVGGVVEGTWTASDSPYIIQGAILVPNSRTLNIEPGVKVEFRGSYKFLVLGELNAVGTVNDSITFTSNNPSVGWLGVRFENTLNSNDSSNFSYCKFEYGRADSPSPLDNGGALFFDNYSKVNISNSLIENCYAEANGGAIFCDNNSSPKIINNTIRNNTAKERGGGIYSGDSCSPLIESNTITSNTVIEIAGAGIYQYDFGGPGSPTINNNKITYNIGVNAVAGGMRILSKSAVITNNIITHNEANGDIGGGGIYIGKVGNGGTGNIISHNIIANNKSSGELDEYGGGGIFCTSPGIDDIISNNLIANNSCSENGGGIYFSNSRPTMFNNTIVNNSSRNGGGIYCTNSSNPEINNSIFWGNSASSSGNQIYIEDEGSDPDIYYCNIEGGISSVQHPANTFYLGDYTDNINSNPLFNAPSSGAGSAYDGVNSDWTLSSIPQSPCINLVSPTSETSTLDLAGNPRVFGGLIDLGCYESIQEALPVEFLYFTGEQIDDRVFLHWATASETNNAGFEVERSANGAYWESLSFVSNSSQNVYDFTDELNKQYTGKNIYYRLKQIDFDGSFHYSETVRVTLSDRMAYILYPNPAFESLTITNNKTGTVDAKLYNFNGKVITAFSFSETYHLNTSTLPKGLYTLIINGHDEAMSFKVVLR